jgi:hypothetical protein
MTQKVLDTAWRSHVEAIIPASAPLVQHQECRRAFYAGAGAPLGGIMRSLDPGLEPTDDDLQVLDNIQAELERFAQDVTEGSA